jgi:hypothetical protein
MNNLSIHGLFDLLINNAQVSQPNLPTLASTRPFIGAMLNQNRQRTVKVRSSEDLEEYRLFIDGMIFPEIYEEMNRMMVLNVGHDVKSISDYY